MEGEKDDAYYEERAQQGLKRLKELEDSPGWIANGAGMFKQEIEGRVASKGVAKAAYNIKKVYQFLDQQETLKKINPMLLEIKVLKFKENVYRVNYMEYKGIWPVDNRDFVNISAKEVGQNKIYISTIACDYPVAAKKGTVRGEVYVGGYIIEAIDQNTTQISYFSDADLKGSIPGMIKNTLSAKQGEIASKVEPAMKKEKI